MIGTLFIYFLLPTVGSKNGGCANITCIIKINLILSKREKIN